MNTSLPEAMRRMAPLSLAFLLSACADMPLLSSSNEDLRGSITQKLDEVCPRPPGYDVQKFRMIRAQLLLASIAGYAQRSINSYSPSDQAKSDAILVLDRLNAAQMHLVRAQMAADSGPSHPELYLMDLLDSGGDAAEGALRPTFRAVKSSFQGLSLSSDTLKRSKQMLLNLLEDGLYIKALQYACSGLTDPTMDLKFAQDRYEYRCGGLRKLGDQPEEKYCKLDPESYLASTATQQKKVALSGESGTGGAAGSSSVVRP